MLVYFAFGLTLGIIIGAVLAFVVVLNKFSPFMPAYNSIKDTGNIIKRVINDYEPKKKSKKPPSKRSKRDNDTSKNNSEKKSGDTSDDISKYFVDIMKGISSVAKNVKNQTTIPDNLKVSDINNKANDTASEEEKDSSSEGSTGDEINKSYIGPLLNTKNDECVAPSTKIDQEERKSSTD